MASKLFLVNIARKQKINLVWPNCAGQPCTILQNIMCKFTLLNANLEKLTICNYSIKTGPTVSLTFMYTLIMYMAYSFVNGPWERS